jgi:uncharacterized delta-60 repeat protein
MRRDLKAQKSHLASLTLAVLSVLNLHLSIVCAAPGDLDTAFAGTGKVRFDSFGSDTPGAQATGLAIQQDGKIVVAGDSPPPPEIFGTSSQTRFALVRFNPDGSLDAAFGTNGITTTVVGTNLVSAGPVAIQSDGKIVLAGMANGAIAAVRYNADGSLDTSFGDSGETTTTFPGTAGAAAMAIQSDGKIVLVSSSGGSAFTAIRYTTNGVLDTSFGTGGIASITVGTGEVQAYGIGVQSDGKIVVSGEIVIAPGTIDYALARFNSDGSPDNSFGTSGWAVASFGNHVYGYGQPTAIQPDGRILVAGEVLTPGLIGFIHKFGVVRFATNGVFDASFGSGGEVVTLVGEASDGAVALAIQPNGKIIAVGDALVGSNYQYATVRYNPDGSLDNSFGSNGEVLFGFGDGGDDTPSALALDSIGRVVIAGSANGAFGVARLLGDAVPVSLRISLTATNTAVISWPYPSAGWTLQQNSDLRTTNWTATPQTVNNDGTNNFIIVSPHPGNLFFRLEQ